MLRYLSLSAIVANIAAAQLACIYYEPDLGGDGRECFDKAGEYNLNEIDAKYDNSVDSIEIFADSVALDFYEDPGSKDFKASHTHSGNVDGRDVSCIVVRVIPEDAPLCINNELDFKGTEYCFATVGKYNLNEIGSVFDNSVDSIKIGGDVDFVELYQDPDQEGYTSREIGDGNIQGRGVTSVLIYQVADNEFCLFENDNYGGSKYCHEIDEPVTLSLQSAAPALAEYNGLNSFILGDNIAEITMTRSSVNGTVDTVTATESSKDFTNESFQYLTIEISLSD